jgi:hypothetical protein
MAFTYTRSQLVSKAQEFANSASQQSTPATRNGYLQAAQAIADCVNGRVWDLAVASSFRTDPGLGSSVDVTQQSRTALLMKADAALVKANSATGQTQLEYLTEAQGWSKLVEALACNALLSQQYNDNS